MRKVASLVTIKTYDRALNKIFNDLSFKDLNYDLGVIKKYKKSIHLILLCLKSIVFYIKYHLKFVAVTDEVERYITDDSLCIKNPSKIDPTLDYRYILRFYSDAITQYNIIINAERVTKKNSKDKGQYPEWEKLINIDIEELSDINKHIYYLYTLMPFRRLEEYIRMVFIFNISEEDLTNEYKKDRNNRNNYCYIDFENPENSCFYFIIYKTDRFYKRPFKVMIWKKLTEYLIDFIETNNIQNGDKLLKLGKVNIKENFELKNKLNSIFGCSVDVLRHSYIQYVHKLYNKGVISYEDLVEISKLMGHRLKQQIRYYNNKF